MNPYHLKATTTPKKSVRFESSVTVQHLDSRPVPEEKSRAYYSMEELKAMSRNAKTICAMFKQQQGTLSRVRQQQSFVHPSLRGFELNLCPTRLRNKIVTRNTILKHQQKLTTCTTKTAKEKMLELGRVSAFIAKWSKQVAVNQARLDSLQVYGFDYTIPIADAVPISPFPGTANTTKRRRVTGDEFSQLNTSIPIENPVKRRRGSQMDGDYMQMYDT